MKTPALLSIAAISFILGSPAAGADSVRVYPAPPGEPLSRDYKVTVDGKDCPVYVARVAPADQKRRWAAMDDKKNSAAYYDLASFATFDTGAPVTVKVTCRQQVTGARILPSSRGIAPAVRDRVVTLRVTRPDQLTLEVNGSWVGALHLFANPPDLNPPSPNDPNVIYFGPGIHEVKRVVVGDNKTVYIAGGAIVRAVIGPEEKHEVSSYSGLRTYAPTFELAGKNITLRGRGILDCTGCTTHSRHPIFVRGSDIKIEGIIIRDSPIWTIPIRKSDRVSVRNVKLIGYRANSDGIDVCNSRDVTIEKCFIRTLDDLIVVKSDRGQGQVKRIAAKDCVLWNEVAHALSVGAELSEDVDDVRFTNCDVIHDKGREWSLRVYHSDAARISNVRFEDLRIEECPRFISLWIGKAVWSRDQERGHIEGVTFRSIRVAADNPPIELTGFDKSHQVDSVLFENVSLAGKPLTMSQIRSNEFVQNITVR